MFALRNNYIKAQFTLLSPDMNEMIEEDIKNLINDCYDKLINKLPDSLKNKLKNLIFDPKFTENHDSKEKDHLLNQFLSTSLGIGVGVGVGYGLTNIILPVFTISGPTGWIIGGFFGLGNLVYNSSNYIGCWIRLNCFDDVLESFYNFVNKNLDKIIDLY